MKPEKIAGFLAVALIFFAYSRPEVRSLGYLPQRVDLPVGGRDHLAAALPLGVAVSADRGLTLAGRRGLDLVALAPGLHHLTVRWLGLPLRTVEVEAVRPVWVIPGGESIGITLHTAGALVTGQSPVPGPRGTQWPAGRAGLRVGDRILAVGREPVVDPTGLMHAADRAGRAGRQLVLKVARDGRPLCLSVRPAWDRALRRYRIGVVVRSRMEGIGTLSFVEPRSHLYFALGHRVGEPGHGRAVPVLGGRVAEAPILGVRRSFFGRPGEKVGLVGVRAAWGGIAGNGPYGIYGRLRWLPAGRAVPLATVSQVHPGPARLRTVVAGSRVESFAVRIERLYPGAVDGRGLAVRVVDPRLIRLAGGIVQGMSGSPILQDGRLVAVMTHVLVGDSTRGYGVFAQWMWQATHRTLASSAAEAGRHASTAC